MFVPVSLTHLHPRTLHECPSACTTHKKPRHFALFVAYVNNGSTVPHHSTIKILFPLENIMASIYYYNITTYSICVRSSHFANIVLVSYTQFQLDVRGSVHHSKIHKEKSNKIQQCIKTLLFHIYMKLNMFRMTHSISSGA